MSQNSVPMIGVKSEQDKHFDAQKAAAIFQYKMNSKTNALNAALSLNQRGALAVTEQTPVVDVVGQCEKIYQWLLLDIE